MPLWNNKWFYTKKEIILMITMFNNVKILQKSIISFQFLKIIKKKNKTYSYMHFWNGVKLRLLFSFSISKDLNRITKLKKIS